jgi:hypothetical protein
VFVAMVTRWIITNLSSWTRWSWTADLVALYVRGHVFGKRSNAPADADTLINKPADGTLEKSCSSSDKVMRWGLHQIVDGGFAV